MFQILPIIFAFILDAINCGCALKTNMHRLMLDFAYILECVVMCARYVSKWASYCKSERHDQFKNISFGKMKDHAVTFDLKDL